MDSNPVRTSRSRRNSNSSYLHVLLNRFLCQFFRVIHTLFFFPLWILIFKRNLRPTRRFRIKDQQELKKIPFILTSLGFESKTHTLTHSEFQLTALRQSTQTQLNAHLNEFDQITIDLLGFIQPDQTWEVLLKLELKGCYRPSQMRYVHLVLEELTSSLGWHPFWIVESPAPNRSKN